MPSSSLKQNIIDFLNFVETHQIQDKHNCIQTLQKWLNQLELDYLNLEEPISSDDFPDPPENSYDQIYQLVKTQFPFLGMYNTCESKLDVGESKIMVGDACDDLSDIVLDLKEVLWRYSNSTEADALWFFKFSFEGHWGLHLNELRFYLFSECFES